MSEDSTPPSPQPAAKLHGLDPAELLARGLHTTQPSASNGPWQPPTPEQLAILLPQYRIESLLGHGGMGAVYKGTQVALDRPVAIKLLPAELASDADFVARFQREARTLARLQHSSIVTVYDFGQTSAGHLYFVMEYVDGTDLQRILKGPGLKPEQVFELIAQVCEALHYAHRQGVIHRDIKPANILITKDGRAKVADFGLARPTHDDNGDLTGTNVIMGTPDYMAPESRTGVGHVDHRADIFALGVMLYEMLTGRRPHGAFQPPSKRVQVDVRIDEVVLKALQQEPDRRYQQASEMKVDVDRIRTTPPTPVNPKRSKLLIGAFTILGLIVLGLAIPFVIRLISYQRPSRAQSDVPVAPIASSVAWKPLPVPAPEYRTALSEQGWQTTLWYPGKQGVESFTDGALRVHTRWTENGLIYLNLRTLGKSMATLNVGRGGQAWLTLITENGEQGARQFPISTPNLKPGQPVTIEIAFIGHTLIARLDGETMQLESPVPPWRGEIRLGGGGNGRNSVWVEKAEYLNLDGIADPLKALGWKVTATTATPAAPPSSSTSTAAATRDAPFVNSLGMKFVPVAITGGPTSGQRVLFSIWETRVQDYEVFAKETARFWPKPDFEQGPTHPAVLVSWDDAKAFCVWLTNRERQAGRLRTNEEYRLPSDFEWSCAVGIGNREDPNTPPREKLGKNEGVYPWGTAWPPPANAGNYAGEELRPLTDKGKYPNQKPLLLAGRDDGYPETAPVGSFVPNALGLFDLGGNVMEWCEDLDGNGMPVRVRRGSEWGNGLSRYLQSSQRDSLDPTRRQASGGFRVVLAPATAGVAAPSPAPAIAPTAWTNALVLIDPVSHAQMRSSWARTASGIEWRSGPQSAPEFIAGTILVPVELPLSYVVEGEFTCGDADGTYGIFVPVGGERMTTAWIDGYHFAGFGKVDGKDLNESGEPGKASPFTLQANRRYALRVEVRRAADVVDLQFRIDGQLVGQFHGAKDRLSVSTRWWTGPNRTYLMLGANKAGTFHSLKIKALDEAFGADSTAEPKATSATATKEAPFVNTLGMKFVPVPIAGGPTAGQRVLFSVWDTRVQDYAAFVAANPQTDDGWKTRNFNGVPVGIQPDHPVVGVNWAEAQAFCQWLTARDTAAGILPPGLKYRLPSDEEWSWAIGLPAERGATPEEKATNGAKDTIFPWGKEWPPTKKVGNFADESWHARFPPTPRGDGVTLNNEWVRGYDDGFQTTSPVGSFPANLHGLYDMAGNVQQWCEDWCDSAHQGRVLRGSSYYNSSRSVLCSSFRHPPVPPQNRGPYFGFRCVLAPADAPGQAAPAK